MPSSHHALDTLDTLTLRRIASGLDDGTFTMTQLVESHLARIEALNPALRAVLQVNPDALSSAKALDAEMQRSGRRGPLHGVPVLVKDNIATREPGLEAPTAGALLLRGCGPARESPAVARLRDGAGAVLLGTSNPSEWANFRSDPSDSGWSARGGQTVGAYHDAQNPGGSSSGSGVAVDAGLCVLALGTETSGSIISPSAANNIVGIKPTTGLVSRDSVIPISQVQDTVGPMARTVHDAAVMLSVIAGRDENDEKTAAIPFSQIPDYGGACSRTDLSDLRIGIPRNSIAKVDDAAVVKSFGELVEKVRPLVGDLVEFDFPGQDRYDEMTPDQRTDAIAGDFKVALSDYLSKLRDNPKQLHTVEDVCEHTKTTEGEEYPERNVSRFEQASNRGPDSVEYKTALETRDYLAGEGGIKGAVKKHSLDAIMAPSKGSANYFSACGGFPHITIPFGYQPQDVEVKRNDTGNLVDLAPNIPFGVSVIGDAFSEVTLLRVAAVLEDLTRTRQNASAMRLEKFR